MIRLATVIGGLLAIAACGGERDRSAPLSPEPPVPCVEIPGPSDWEYVGIAFEAGEEGAFDRLLWGGFGGSPIRYGDEVLLYYQGARGYSQIQESVRFRSIGLAVSADGTNFTKDEASPVLEWTPRSGEEEGVASVAVAVGPDGEMVAFYGANTQSGPISVNASARWATSTDGRSFVDRGITLSHDDPGVFGSGDELFPVIAFHHRDTWHVYYIPNGVAADATLAVATGARPDALTETASVRVDGRPVRAWGMQSAARLCEDEFALFVSDIRDRSVTVYRTDVNRPRVATGPEATYRFPASGGEPGLLQGAVLLDRTAGYWYLYFRTDDGGRYGIRRAPVVPR